MQKRPSPKPRTQVARLLLTPGEPAGIGPELAVQIAQQAQPAELVAIADPGLLAQRAKKLRLPLRLIEATPDAPPKKQARGTLTIWPEALAVAAKPGQLDSRNADYVLATLRRAVRALMNDEAQALVTGPVQKSVIADAGHRFSGHTEFLAALAGAPMPVMMLANAKLRVALATTHLALRDVPVALRREPLEQVLRVLHGDLQAKFGIRQPRILVCGLNPHAGEDGHLGREEIEVITPVLEKLRTEGIRLQGPLPADTLFTPQYLDHADAVLAMYHDQGLPVLKYAGFGESVNITLGLPFIRTSVDHGTALDLAGKGRADAGSLRAALKLAAQLATRS